MKKITRLPDSEFKIMKVLWAGDPPIGTPTIMEQIGKSRGWRTSTAISLLLRLVERGFLRTVKNGKERVYYPVVSKEEYLRYETGHFLELYHENSFASLVNAWVGDKALSESEIKALAKIGRKLQSGASRDQQEP